MLKNVFEKILFVHEELLSLFDERELELLCCGTPHVSIVKVLGIWKGLSTALHTSSNLADC